MTHADERRLCLTAGQSVREALDGTDLRVRAACGGVGACGACVVRWLEGDVNPPTPAEYQTLSTAQRAQGWRLACQLRPRGATTIRLDHPARPSHWHSIPVENLVPWSAAITGLEQHRYGVAVDLGTSHIRVALWDRRHGRRIAARCGPNPQQAYGADVLNRLSAAVADPARAGEMARLARDAIMQALRDMLVRDVGEVHAASAEIGQVLVVGNTAMLALLTGHGAETLLDPANWQRSVDCQPRDVLAWQAQWPLPHAAVRVLNAVAGFVGSDLVADVIATRLTEGPSGALLLDLGTNTEIALWDGCTLHVSSVPGGSAFEGSGIRHGMAAEPGAIFRVRPTLGQEAGFACEVIGGGPALGLCGSGLTDAIAVLLEAGLLKPSGRFTQAQGAVDGLASRSNRTLSLLPGEGHARYALLPDNPLTSIDGGDVDAFQRAKAATAAAMATLLGLAGMAWSDIRRLCVCGAFGRTLDVGHAQRVGLLPALDRTCIELYADTALAGCERALLSADGEQLFAASTAKMQLVNLAYVAGYEDRYIDYLRLCPIPLHTDDDRRSYQSL